MSALGVQNEFAALNSRKPSTTSSSSRRRESEESIPASLSSTSSAPRSSPSSPGIMPTSCYQIPQTHFDANTGPKGVIADAQSYERARKRTFRQTIYDFSNSLAANVTEKLSKPTRRRNGSKSGSESSDDEDEFMKSWREKRMLELQQGKTIHNRRLSPSKRSWGRLVAVDPVGYLDAIEKVTMDTTVVVLINDEESTISGIVEDAVSDLARKHEFTRFVKLNYRDAEMNPAGVPAILAYKNGELFANLVSVVDEIPDGRDLSTRSLEAVLQQYNIV